MKGLMNHGMNQDIADKLTIEHFLTDIDSKRFIDDLSWTIVNEARQDESSKEFVAKPFIRSFEYALNSLQGLRTQVESRVSELELAASEAEKRHNRAVISLNQTFEDVQIATSELESQIGEVSVTAVRIGQQLESVDRQRNRAFQARDLCRFFLEFSNQGQCNQLEEMRSVQGPDGQYKAAIIARKLSNISKELDLPGIENTRASIDKYNENLEKDLLETFDQAYTNGDISTMASCSRTLLDFNGGASCVQTYINQHEFFMSQRKMRESSIDFARHSFEASQAGLNDPNEPPPPPDPWMVKLYNEVRIVVAKEWDVISQVFPNSIFVLRQFLERIFGQSIETYLEGLLEKANNQSTLAYLRTLASTHACTSNLVLDLQQFDRQQIYPLMRRVGQMAANEKNGNDILFIGTGLISHEKRCTAVSSTVDRCLEDFFVHIRYLDREISFMNTILPSTIEAYFTKHKSVEGKASTKQSMFTRLAKATDMITSGYSTPVGVISPLASGPPSPSRSQFLPLHHEEPESIHQSIAISLNPLPTTVLDIIIRILCIHGEAMSRCAELSPVSDLSSNANRLFATLIDNLSERFLDKILNKTFHDIGLREQKNFDTEATLKNLKLTSQINQAMGLIQKHYQITVLPLVASSPPAYRESVVKKNSLLSNLESSTNQILQLETTCVLQFVSITLSTQPKLIFRTRDDKVDLIVLSTATETCSRCCEVLKRVFVQAQAQFKGHNLEAFLIELGTGLHTLLLEHYKKFTVTPSGSLLLFRDISLYQTLIRDLKIDSLNDKFEMLGEIGKLLHEPNPSAIPSLLREGTLATLDHATIYPYLRCREDFHTADIARLINIQPETLQQQQQSNLVSANSASANPSLLHFNHFEETNYIYNTATLSSNPNNLNSVSSLGISGMLSTQSSFDNLNR